MRLFRAKVPTIGMDLDSGAIKAVQLGQNRDGYVLQHVGYHKLPAGVIVEGEVADAELLAREVRSFWELHEFRGKSVILGVSGNNVIVRFVDFPRLSDADLASALGFQAEEHIPLPIEEVILDHVVLGPSPENPEEDQVILVAAHQDVINRYTDAVRAGGLKPAGVDVKALSLTRSTLPLAVFDDEDTTLLIDIGTEFTNLSVVQGQTPTHAQFLNVGFQDFVAAVAAAADLEEDEAEKVAVSPLVSISPFVDEINEDTNRNPDVEDGGFEITEPLYIPQPEEGDEPAFYETYDAPDSTDEADEDITYEDATYEENPEPENPEPEEDASGSEPTFDETGQVEERSDDTEETTALERAGGDTSEIDPALAYDARRGLEEAVTRLGQELQRSVEFHNSRAGAREVSRVVVSGEGALVAGITNYLEDYLDLPTTLAKPTEKLVENRSNISDEQLSQMETVLAVAIGLAMEE